MKNVLLKTGEQMAVSGAYGDAYGVPVETKSFRYIREKFGSVDKLIAANDNIFFKGEWKPGTTSDDTQHFIAVAKALMRSDDFILETIAEELIVAFHETPDVTWPSGKVSKLGWGGSSTNSIRRQIEGMSPYESGELDGRGNGILMKLHALAFWQAARGTSDEERYRQYDELTTMTHDGDLARITTRVHGDVLLNLLSDNPVSMEDFSEFVLERVDYHENYFGTTHEVSETLGFLRTHPMPTPNDIEQLYLPRALNISEEKFGKSYSFSADETLLVAYTAFMYGAGDYKRTVYTAVNLGGDADSTASIAGAMVNFLRKGEQDMPEDVEKVQDIERLRKLSKEFSRRALNLVEQ